MIPEHAFFIRLFGGFNLCKLLLLVGLFDGFGPFWLGLSLFHNLEFLEDVVILSYASTLGANQFIRIDDVTLLR